MKIEEQTIGSIVASDFRTASVFEKYHIDFCCGGKKILKDACEEKKVDKNLLLHDLESVESNDAGKQTQFVEMDTSGLIGYIMLQYHFAHRNQLPIIQQHLDKVVFKHGERFPFMVEVASLWKTLTTALLEHMKEEEQVVFPLLKSTHVNSSDLELIENLENDHEKVGELLSQIRYLTDDFNPPPTACTTFRISLQELEAFEAALHQHVHLENNILFPRFLN